MPVLLHIYIWWQIHLHTDTHTHTCMCIYCIYIIYAGYNVYIFKNIYNIIYIIYNIYIYVNTFIYMVTFTSPQKQANMYIYIYHILEIIICDHCIIYIYTRALYCILCVDIWWSFLVTLWRWAGDPAAAQCCGWHAAQTLQCPAWRPAKSRKRPPFFWKPMLWQCIHWNLCQLW